MKNDELMSRRGFFKKTAKGMLPMLGAFVAAPTIATIFTSCGCNGCEATCSDDCEGTCKYNCYDSCSSSSASGGCSDCSSSCGNNCSSNCSTTCNNSSQISPSSQGDGSYSNPFNATEAHNYAASLAAGETTANSFYIKGIVSSVKYNYSAQYGTATFFITDDGKTEDIFQVYGAYYLENKPYTSGDLLSKGDKVIVYGKLCNYKGTTPELADKQGYLYSLNGKTKADVISGGDGSRNNPYSANKASDYAKSLGADVISSNDVYVTGIISSIKYEYSANYGTAVYNISDTGRAENEFTIYSSYFFDNKPWKEGNTQIKVGDTVIVCGRVIYYKGNTPEMAEKKSWLYSLNGKTSDSGNSGCTGSCTSTCSSTCTDTCEGLCAVGCTSSCGANCTGDCKGGCSTTCTGGCDTSCNTGCSSECSKYCGSGCSSNCTKSCADDCTYNCTAKCADNCTYGCEKTCADDCTYNCKSICADDCLNTCKGDCKGDCKTGCTTGCYGGCKGACASNCDQACTGRCSSLCTSSSKSSSCSSCTNTCYNLCMNTCKNACYSSCQNIGRAY